MWTKTGSFHSATQLGFYTLIQHSNTQPGNRGNYLRKASVTSALEVNARISKDLSIHGPEDGAGDEKRHNDGESAQRLFAESHGDRGRFQHLQRRQDGEVSEIGQQVEKRGDQHANGDG